MSLLLKDIECWIALQLESLSIKAYGKLAIPND